MKRVALVVSASLQPRVRPDLSDLLAKVRRENGRVVTAVLMPDGRTEARRVCALLGQRMRAGEFEAVIAADAHRISRDGETLREVVDWPTNCSVRLLTVAETGQGACR